MVQLSINDLKQSRKITKDIRWDVTPQLFLDPSASCGGDPSKSADITHGYMLYIDMIYDKPAIVIMQLKEVMSKTVGFISDVPEEMLKEAMHCSNKECIAGMYPLTEKLEKWLKHEFSTG